MRDRPLLNEGPNPPMRGRGRPWGIEATPMDRSSYWRTVVGFFIYRLIGTLVRISPLFVFHIPLVPSSCPLCGLLLSSTFDSLDRRSTTFKNLFTTSSTWLIITQQNVVRKISANGHFRKLMRIFNFIWWAAVDYAPVDYFTFIKDDWAEVHFRIRLDKNDPTYRL